MSRAATPATAAPTICRSHHGCAGISASGILLNAMAAKIAIIIRLSKLNVLGVSGVFIRVVVLPSQQF